MESKAVERISAYFSGRGIELSEQDKAEVHARILGHESAEDLRVFSEKAKVFYAHRGDLNDFDRTGLFSGAATLASPVVCEGAKDQVLRYAFLEAQASKYFIAVFDGNGNLCQLFDKHEPTLALFRSEGRLKNPSADFADELAEDRDLIDARMGSWTHAGKVLATEKSRIQRDRREPAGQTLLYILEDGNQKVLWRERI